MGSAASKKQTRATPVLACILSGWAVGINVKGGGTDVVHEVTSTMTRLERMRILAGLAMTISGRVFAPLGGGRTDSSVMVDVSIAGDYGGELAPEIKEALSEGWVGFDGNMAPLKPTRTLDIVIHTTVPGTTETLVESVGGLLSLPLFVDGGVQSSLEIYDSVGMGFVFVEYGPADIRISDAPAGCGVHAK
jgi:hypothetical protein